MANQNSSYTPEPSNFEIVPLDDTLGLPTITLKGTELPYKGLQFSTEQRIKTTYYPGNPQASQTVLGPTLPNTTIGGRWMDLSMTDGGARVLVRQIEYMVQHAVPVEVQWGGRNFGDGSFADDDPAIVRRGLIKKIDPKYNRLEDIEWTIEFEWAGEGMQSQSPTMSSDMVDHGSDFVDLESGLELSHDTTSSWTDAVWEVISTATNAMLAVSDALDYVQNRIVDAITVVDGATNLLQNVAELPGNIANRIRGVCDRVVLACANARAATGNFCGVYSLNFASTPNTSWGAGNTPGGTNNPISIEAARAKLAMYPTDDPMSRLDGETALHDVVSQWDTIAALAAQRSAALQAQILPDVIAIERPPAGSDLRDLAVKYYNDSTLWVVIAAFPPNSLVSSEVPAIPTGPSDTGAPPIYIPRLTSTSTALAELWGNE
jgi:hypothetical protein